MLHGGITAATRLPSGSRESRIGFASEMSLPRRRAMFLTATIKDFSFNARSRTCSSTPARSMKTRSEEHTSELQSPDHLLCRLLLEKKNTSSHNTHQQPPR